MTREVTDRIARLEVRVESVQRALEAMPVTVRAAVSSAVSAALHSRGAERDGTNGDMVSRALEIGKQALQLAGWAVAAVLALKGR